MGSFKSKSTSTTTPIVNEPMKTNLVDLASLSANILKTDPLQFVAPASPLQEQAFAGAQNLGGWQKPSQEALGMAQNAGGAGASTYQAPQLGQAAQAQAAQLGPAAQAQAAPQAQAQSLLSNLSAYMNPYTKDVVDASMKDWDAQFGRMDAELQAKGAGAGAFGGSRYGVERGIFGGEALRGRGALNANLRADAFNTGAALSGQDADRRQNASFFNIGNTQQRNLFNTGQQNEFALQQGGFNQQANMFNTGAQNQFALAQGGMDADAAQYNAQAGEAALQRAMQAAGLTANIGADMGSQSRADLGLSADLGAMQRMIQEAKLQAPINQLIDVGQLYNMIPQASYIGANNVTKGSTPWGPAAIGAIGSIASSFAAKSERRLKRDIERIGEHEGLGLYRYNYIWDAIDRAPRTGVMVDEVERIAPHALGPLIDGDKTVDYAKLGLAHLVEGK